MENELLRHTAEDIARFLYKGEGLNKTAIGDYLGERWAGPVAAGRGLSRQGVAYHDRAGLIAIGRGSVGSSAAASPLEPRGWR